MTAAAEVWLRRLRKSPAASENDHILDILLGPRSRSEGACSKSHAVHADRKLMRLDTRNAKANSVMSWKFVFINQRVTKPGKACAISQVRLPEGQHLFNVFQTQDTSQGLRP